MHHQLTEQHLSLAGMPAHVVALAAQKGILPANIWALVLEYGLPAALKILQALLGGGVTPPVPTP